MRMRPTKAHQIWKSLALLVVLVMLLSACAAPVAPAPAAPAQQAAGSSGGEAAAKPKLPADAAPEQVLRISTGSTGSASFTFYPMSGGGDHQSWMPLLYVPPLYFDVDLNLKPGVFDSWKSNEDFTEWTFTIDPRAKFSDGSPITAQDVKGTWEIMADPESEHGRIQQYIGNVDGFADVHDKKATEIPGITVVDQSTIKVKLLKPDAIFNWRIATTHMNPLKVEQVKADRENFWLPENKPVFSGPYMLESYNPDLQEATLVPNPNWWMDEGPYLQKIEFHFQPEPETLAVQLQNNEVDASLGGIPLALKDQFPDYFRPVKALGFNSFWLATTNEPTSDLNVRKALVLSVDLEAVFKAAYPDGDAVLATQVLDPDLTCLDKENSWYKYDPEAAKQALTASQYGSADKLPKLRVTPRGTDVHMNRALEAVIEFWRKNLGITNVEFQQKPDGFGDDQKLLNLSRDDVVIRFPDSATYMYVGADTAGPIARELMLGYSNPDIDGLLTQALALPSDDPKRCDLALQAQRKFMDDYPTIFFGIQGSTINARDYVANYEKGPDVGLIAPWRIYLKAH